MTERPFRDADTAWQLLRALKPRAADANGQRQAHCGNNTLTIRADGAWQSPGAGAESPGANLFDQLTPVTAPRGSRFAVAQIAQSLDGRTATARGQADRLTGEADQRRLHRVRALVDAVVIGAATALADDPQLTVRAVPGDQPVRVILDRSRRLPGDHYLLRDRTTATLRVVDAAHPEDDEGVLAVPGMAPADILDALARRGLTRVLIEGGGRTVSRFLEAGCLNRLHLVIAPVLLGQGPSGLELPAIDGMEQARRPRCRQHQLGPDVLFDLDLRA